MKPGKFLLLLCLSFLWGCSGGSRSEPATASNTSPVAALEDKATTGGGGGGARSATAEADIVYQQVSLNEAEKSATGPANALERKIIKNAELTLESGSPEETQAKIGSMIEAKGGFVLESTQSGGEVGQASRNSVSLTLRIPASKFNEALDEIRKAAGRIIVETIKSDDVTEEFIDVEARVKTQKALEEQFLEIMKRANTVEDALNVQSKLADVRGEIEKAEGRKRFLENQINLSTIKLRIQTPNSFSPNSSSFFYKLSQAVSDGFDGAMGFVLFFVQAAIALLPFLILVVLPIFLLIRYLLRKRKKKETPESIVEKEVSQS